MFDRTPQALLIEKPAAEVLQSAWVEKLCRRVARVRDYLDEEVATHDFIDRLGNCPYEVGDHVMLCHPERQQKMWPPYERGWVVEAVIASSTT